MPTTSERRRGGWTQLAILIGIFAVLLLAAIWIYTRPASQPSQDAGRAIAADFLQQIQEGEAGTAWESSTAEFKSAQGKESFLRQVRPRKFLSQPLEFVSSQTVNLGTEARTEYLFRAADGESVRIVLGREGRAWKVDHWLLPNAK